MKMKSIQSIFTFTITIICAQLGHSETIVASSPSRADVGAAYDRCVDGDTLLIPAGESTWTQSLGIEKGITIMGSGVDSTIIRDAVVESTPVNKTEAIIYFITESEKAYRLTGIRFENAGRSTYYEGSIQIHGDGRTIRIDNCYFDRLNSRAVYWRGYTRGLVDHCYFDMGGNQAVTISPSAWGGGASGNGSWNAPDQMGTSEAVFIEDCTMIASDNGGLTDGFNGARFVVRHCNIVNGHIASHGTESTRHQRGTRIIEVYENTFQHDRSGSNAYAVNYRSGTGVVFNNTGTGGHTNMVKLSNYRNHTAYQPWGGADGENPFDKNAATTPYEFGTATSGGSRSLTDSGKSWTNDQWKGYTVKIIGAEGVATGGSNGQLQDSQSSWEDNQWDGWQIRNLNSGRTRTITKNTATTSSFSGDGLFSFTSGEPYQIFKFAYIGSNTANTLTLSGAISSEQTIIGKSGDDYEIWKVEAALDMPGMGRSGTYSGGSKPSPVDWVDQEISPIYQWNNSFESSNNSIGGDPTMVEGVHYFNDVVKPNYTPYTYPHPFQSELVSLGSPPSGPDSLVINN